MRDTTIPADFKISQYDTLPVFYAFLNDSNVPPRPVQLAVDTQVEFVMTPDDTLLPTLTASATIVDLTTSEVRYNWAPGDTDMAGRYYAKWVCRFNDGSQLTFPNGGEVAVDITSRTRVYAP